MGAVLIQAVFTVRAEAAVFTAPAAEAAVFIAPAAAGIPG